jgi:hypothetical protein
MPIAHKGEFTRGIILSISFLVVLAIIYSPVFKGKNGLEAADELFNSIAKGSTYYIPSVMQKNEAFLGKDFKVTIAMNNADMAEKTALLFSTAGALVDQSGAELTIRGDLGKVLGAALQDADNMFNNRGDALADKYGYDPKEAMYNWWSAFKLADKALKKQKMFKEAKFVSEVQTKAVETGYNFYGIAPEPVSKRAGILSFSLVFYVVYTLWWGFAIFYLFEGWGLRMEAAKEKKEV